MIKKNLKILILTSIMILLPIIAGVILWDKLPEQMPIHWNISGEVDKWCGKAFAVIAMPLLMLAIHWICLAITFSDPKNHGNSGKILHITFWIIPVINLALSAFTYSAAMGNAIKTELFASLLLGFIFIVTGNYMPKCRQSYTVGIKLPWTLHSEENWNKTHRFAGRVWLVGGVIITVGGFFGSFFITLAVAPLMALLPILYSFMLHRKGV
jgi:uncharacterized membrane protein